MKRLSAEEIDRFDKLFTKLLIPVYINEEKKIKYSFHARLMLLLSRYGSMLRATTGYDYQI